MNYFTLFELEPRFEVDIPSLTDRYRQLQSQYHPDRFATASQGEQLQAVQRAAQINDGFTTLKSPIKRAEHLLALRGFELKDEQQTLQDSAFLMQQFEWREQLAELSYATDKEAALADFRQQVEGVHHGLLTQLAQALAQQQNEQASQLVRKLMFINKLIDELNQFEDSLFDY